MNIGQAELEVVQADLTALEVEAIVNPANNQMRMGGGVAGVIRQKGGEEIEQEAMEQAPVKVGEAVSTGAGRLKARYVIHAATMAMDFQTDEHKVRAAAASALKEADRIGATSLAFPALGCGVGRFPLVAAAKIMTQEVLKHLRRNKGTSLKKILFCLYEPKAYTVFEQTVTGYVRHILEDLGPEPYVTTDIIIEVGSGIVVIERSNPPFGWALPGGFLDPGESLEEAAAREAKEETNLDLEDLRQMHTYSDPDRDPRFHTISTVFIARGVGEPRCGDDAKGLRVVPREQILKETFAFDHGRIIQDYLDRLREGRPR